MKSFVCFFCFALLLLLLLYCFVADEEDNEQRGGDRVVVVLITAVAEECRVDRTSACWCLLLLVCFCSLLLLVCFCSLLLLHDSCAAAVAAAATAAAAAGRPPPETISDQQHVGIASRRDRKRVKVVDTDVDIKTFRERRGDDWPTDSQSRGFPRLALQALGTSSGGEATTGCKHSSRSTRITAPACAMCAWCQGGKKPSNGKLA